MRWLSSQNVSLVVFCASLLTLLVGLAYIRSNLTIHKHFNVPIGFTNVFPMVVFLLGSLLATVGAGIIHLRNIMKM